MTDDLPGLLGTWAGRRTVGGEVAALLRKQDFAGTERLLVDRLTQYPGPIATACRGVSADQVTVDGWEQLDADLVDLGNRGHVVTAIGLDLSNYSDAEGDVWWDKEPVVEFAAYTDEVFPFSVSRRQDLLDRSAVYPSPWTDQPLGVETAQPAVTGLRALNGALLHRASVEPWRPQAAARLSDESVAEYLGWWWLHVRFQQAVARHLDERGLAITVPVIVGTHDVGPWLQAVHPVQQVSDHRTSTERILGARAQEGPARRDAETVQTVRDLRELRRKLRSFGFLRRGADRKAAEEFAAAKVAVTCQRAGLPHPTRSIGQMGDKEFERLLESFRTTTAGV